MEMRQPPPPGLMQRMGAALQRAGARLAGAVLQPQGGHAPAPADDGRAGAPPQPTARRSYAAAQVNRLTEGWSTISLSANADVHASVDALRARSRQLARDNPHWRKYLTMVRDNVVGPSGFVLQARVYDEAGRPDRLANEAIERAWAQWCVRGLCEITGKHNFASLQKTIISTAARDGEFLVRIVRGAAAGPWGYALQLLDIDRLDTGYNRAPAGGQAAIRMGVEIDDYGRPVAYHLRTRHPGDIYTAAGQAEARRERVPAADIIHGYIADRPEQLRGVPWGHASMLTLASLAGYQEAAIVNARAGAAKMGFFTTPDGQAETLADAKGEGGELYMDMDAGSLQSLPPGVEFTAFTPEYPAQMYRDFVQGTLRDVATGLCVAYHSLANNLEGVSFSSIRSGTLEERDAWMVLQGWFMSELLDPIYREWLSTALAMGQVTLPNGSPLPLSKSEKFSAHTWQGRRWEWVDPLRDIQADLEAIRAGLKAPQAVAAKMGQDYEDVVASIAQAAQLAQQAGVPLAWMTPPAPAATTAAAAEAEP